MWTSQTVSNRPLYCCSSCLNTLPADECLSHFSFQASTQGLVLQRSLLGPIFIQPNLRPPSHTFFCLVYFIILEAKVYSVFTGSVPMSHWGCRFCPSCLYLRSPSAWDGISGSVFVTLAVYFINKSSKEGSNGKSSRSPQQVSTSLSLCKWGDFQRTRQGTEEGKAAREINQMIRRLEFLVPPTDLRGRMKSMTEPAMPREWSLHRNPKPWVWRSSGKVEPQGRHRGFAALS